MTKREEPAGLIMALQLADGAITIEDLRDFNEDVRNTIVEWSRI